MRDINDYALKYREEPCEKFQVQYRRKKVLELMKHYKHETILEIGCGMEPLFTYMANDYKCMVVVEPAEDFVGNLHKEIAKHRVEKQVIGIKGFFENEIQRIKDLDVGFDYIVISSLLHELENPEHMLGKVRELCREETVIHVNVPNAYSVHRMLAKAMGLIEDVHQLSPLQLKMQRQRVFDLKSLCRFAENNGFEILESGSYFMKFFTAGQMEEILKNQILSENIFEGFDKLSEYFPENGSEIFVQMKKREEA